MRIRKDQMYDTIRRNLPVGYLVVDDQGIIVDFNPAAERITGFTRNDVLGESHLKMMHGTSNRDACPLIKHSIERREQTVETATTMRVRNGEMKTVAVTAFPLIDEGDLFFGGVELFRDVTVAKQMECEQRNMLSMLAHDMKNPVMASGALLGRVLSGAVGPVNEKQEGYLRTAREALLLVEDMLCRFLEYSALGSKGCEPVLRPYDMAASISKVMESVEVEAELKNVTIFSEYPDGIPHEIWADASMVNRVLANLLQNALKYSSDAGTIGIIVSQRQDDLLVQVKDTGIGISGDQLPHVFDPFFRVNQDSIGAGLGLSIAQTLIEAHGGRIWVESSPGEGSIFSFTLPKTPGGGRNGKGQDRYRASQTVEPCT